MPLDKQTAWTQLWNAGKALLATVLAFSMAVIAYVNATKTETVPATPVVVPAQPATPPTVTPAKPVTVVVPTVAPADVVAPAKITTVIVEDEVHNRIHPRIANTITNLADFEQGTYYYIGYPEEGAPVRRTITISDGTTPRPPPVTTPVTPVTPAPVVDPSLKPTAATYVYEKDQGGVPSFVMSGLNRLNREKKIVATVFEDDSTNGKNEVPAQYKVALAKAREAGTPALIVTAGDVVLSTVKAPKTEQEVFEAVK